MAESERCNGRNRRRFEEEERLNPPLLTLKTEKGGHKPRSVCVFQMQRMPELTGTAEQGQLYGHRELSSANNLSERETDSPLDPPEKNAVLVSVA